MILTKLENRVATLTFNRPDKLNALNGELISRAIETLTTWAEDAAVGAIVVTGAGRAFCAGGDVSMMAKDADWTLEQNIDRLREWQELLSLLFQPPKGTIPAID